MKIPSLSITNFLSIADVTLDLSEQGLVGVFGVNHDAPGASSNGSGKSSIWDALTWCLYGRTFRGLDGDDIVKLRSKGGCWVEAEIIIDGQEWTIERYRKHPKFKNELHLWHGESELTAATVAETQARIIKLLGMDYDTFAVCVAFGQDTLRFAKATDKEQKAILDRILGTEQYERAYETARNMKVGLESDRRNLTENVRCAESVRLSNEQLIKEIKESQEKRVIELESAREKLIGKIAYLKGDLAKSPEKTVGLTKRRDELRAEYGELQKKVGKDNTSLIRSLKNELSTKANAVHQAKEFVIDTEDELDKVKANSTASKCKECNQTINEVEYTKQLTNAQEKAIAAYNQWAKLNGEYKKLDEEKSGEINRLMREQLEFAESNNTLIKSKAALSRAESELDAHKDAERNLSSQIKEQEFRLSSLDTKVDDSDKIIKSREEKIKECQATVATLNAETTELDALIKSLDFWIKGFGPGGIRSFIIDSMVPYLTERAQYYADALMDGSIQIVFNTQKTLKSGELREKFEVQVLNAYGADIYNGNSAGERQRIDVCVALALYDLARTRAKAPVELVVFDEAFERLDTAGCDRIIRLLKKESKNWKSCFVTTHSADLAVYFDKKLTISKKDGESRLVSQKGPQHGKTDRESLEAKSSSVE